MALTPYQTWQLQYFGCTNCPQAQPGADADGTGQNNNFKYAAGLNPTNAASVFTFTISIDTNAPGIQLNFGPVVAGRTYAVLCATDLLNSAWAPLTGGVTNFAGSQETITDTATSPAQKFYTVGIAFP